MMPILRTSDIARIHTLVCGYSWQQMMRCVAINPAQNGCTRAALQTAGKDLGPQQSHLSGVCRLGALPWSTR